MSIKPQCAVLFFSFATQAHYWHLSVRSKGYVDTVTAGGFVHWSNQISLLLFFYGFWKHFFINWCVFFPSPKPKANFVRCKDWITLSGRPHHHQGNSCFYHNVSLCEIVFFLGLSASCDIVNTQFGHYKSWLQSLSLSVGAWATTATVTQGARTLDLPVL